MKASRQKEIVEIVTSMEIETQEQLQEELRRRGFSATQATISRDVKELYLVKELSPSGVLCYTQRGMRAGDLDIRLRTIFQKGVLSVDVAQNIVVLKTMPGLASAACSALDSIEIPGMVGSLAGDDTGLLIMRDNTAALKFSDEVHMLLD